MVYMSRQRRDRPLYIALSVAACGVAYAAVAIAPYAGEGLPGIIRHAEEISFEPSALVWLPSTTPKTIAMCLFLYALAAIIFISSRKRYHRRGVEQGSADFADPAKLRREFHSNSPLRVVYTENFAMSVTKEDTYKHKRNYNTLLVGGPGSGKTTGYAYPNLLEASASYIILDPKGEVCRNTAKYLQEEHGYDIRVLNLVNPNYSWGYNPFHYIAQDTAEEQRADDDIQKIVTAIFQATTAPNTQTTDPFWDEAGKMLLSALMYLLYYFGAPKERNFPYLMSILRLGRTEGKDQRGNQQKSDLDILFAGLEAKHPDHIAVRFYHNARSGAVETWQSVLITLMARLQKFELSSLGAMMSKDELGLTELCKRPMALYCIIPDNDTSYNFIVSLLYIQLFQTLYRQADNEYKGRLPRFVHFIMDEFANVHTPEDFLGILASCRSRNIGISIILQNLAQLKAKYKDGWENIIGQCDEFMYLGGNEQSTHEYVSKMLGKETIDTSTWGRRYGMHGDSSENYNFAGRELLTPDEVRLLPYNQAVLFIKNAPPLVDRKIDVFHYKKAAGTAIRGNKAMEYEIPLRSVRLGKKHPAPTTDVADVDAETLRENAALETYEAHATDARQQPTAALTIAGSPWDVGTIRSFYGAYIVDPEEAEAFVAALTKNKKSQ